MIFSRRTQAQFLIPKRHWEKLPQHLRQELLVHVPMIWVIWTPYIRWIPFWGRFVPNNLDVK